MVRNIQVLRCVAALVVVWHHLQTQLHLQMDMPPLGFHGRAGVDIFFVISGFIMFHTTWDARRRVTRFWIDRVIRIAPLYWLATLAVTGLVLVGFHPAGVMKISLEDVIADMLFLPDIREELGEHVYEVDDINAKQPDACATHLFTDPNVAFAEAFLKVMRREIDMRDEHDMAAYQIAWDLAKRRGFGRE